MPAIRRTRYAKRTKPYRKRSSKPSRKFTSTVKKIIRNTAETKKSFGSLSPLIGLNTANQVTSTQILYKIAQGTGDHQRIGDSIIPTSLRLDIVSYSNVDSTLITVLLIKQKLMPFANTTSLSYEHVFCYGPGNQYVLDHPDPEKCTVLKRWDFKHTAQYAGQSIRKYLNTSKALQKTPFQYDGDNSGYGKKFTYHLIVISTNDWAVNHGIVINYTVNFKDV
jgi:hypothetical protein